MAIKHEVLAVPVSNNSFRGVTIPHKTHQGRENPNAGLSLRGSTASMPNFPMTSIWASNSSVSRRRGPFELV